MDRPEPEPGGRGAPPVLHVAADAATLAQDLAARVADQLRDALQRRPRATLLLSGGRTPIPMWQALSRQALPWSRVDVSLVDERWVPMDDPSSNGGLLQQHLLQHEAAAACWHPLSLPGIASGLTPGDGADALEAQLRTLIWPADVVVLGMGADGHTASLFSAADVARGAGRLAVAVQRPDGLAGISVTPGLLRRVDRLVFLVSGAGKREMARRLLESPDTLAAGLAVRGCPKVELWVDRAAWPED